MLLLSPDLHFLARFPMPWPFFVCMQRISKGFKDKCEHLHSRRTWGEAGESPSLTIQAVEAGASKLTSEQRGPMLFEVPTWCKWLLTNWPSCFKPASLLARQDSESIRMVGKASFRDAGWDDVAEEFWKPWEWFGVERASAWAWRGLSIGALILFSWALQQVLGWEGGGIRQL